MDIQNRTFLSLSIQFVHTNAHDNFWGIGFSLKHPQATEVDSWKGNNWFGVSPAEACHELFTD